MPKATGALYVLFSTAMAMCCADEPWVAFQLTSGEQWHRSNILLRD